MRVVFGTIEATERPRLTPFTGEPRQDLPSGPSSGVARYAAGADGVTLVPLNPPQNPEGPIKKTTPEHAKYAESEGACSSMGISLMRSIAQAAWMCDPDPLSRGGRCDVPRGFLRTFKNV